VKRVDLFDSVAKWSRWLAGALFIAVFLYFIGLEVGWLPKEIQITKENPYTGKTHTEVYDLTSFVIVKTMDGLNYIAPALGAIASLIVAIFTGTLWYSTRLLWRETERLAEGAEGQHGTLKDSVAEARAASEAAKRSADAAVALHRPWIQVEISEGAIDIRSDTVIVTGKAKITNTGQTPAIYVEVYTTAVVSSDFLSNDIEPMIQKIKAGVGFTNHNRRAGITIFPEAYIENMRSIQLPDSQLSKFDDPLRDGKLINVLYAGIVHYEFAGGGRGETPFVYAFLANPPISRDGQFAFRVGRISASSIRTLDQSRGLGIV